MLTEFKTFIAGGNVLSLAVGVLIGAAFGTIVASMTEDLIMPIVGSVTGGADFSNYFVGLNSAVTAPTLTAAKEQGATLAYGNFVTILINFLILAFVLLQLVKFANRLKKAEPPAPPAAPSASETLLAEIRDALKSGAAAPAKKK